MEIQTFLLGELITRAERNRFDVQNAGLHSLGFPPESSFPVQLMIPALMVLRREIASDQAPFSLQFDLVDEDGRSIGQPRRILCRGVFPAGNRFFFFPTQIKFEFPGPGRFRLDITADEGLTGGLFSYGIDVTQTQKPAGPSH
jgi:hypothetical protein